MTIQLPDIETATRQLVNEIETWLTSLPTLPLPASSPRPSERAAEPGPELSAVVLAIGTDGLVASEVDRSERVTAAAGSVCNALSELVREGRMRRTSHGVYAATPRGALRGGAHR
jgi:hypothetical protein